METIIQPYKDVMSVLGEQVIIKDRIYSESHFVLTRQYDGGFLKYNILTGHLIFIDHQEDTDELIKRWFLVNPAESETERCDMLRNSLQLCKKKSSYKYITIFPTTFCNARCQYCFESGRPHMHMSNAIVSNVIKYISNNCKHEHLILRWFGGEPLMNIKAIDDICIGLQHEGILFESRMATNGFAFSSSLIQKALSLWNLKTVQITIDGTELQYNRVKNYRGRLVGSPFQVVLQNIEELTKKGITVIIRLNVSSTNGDDLCKLLDDSLIPHFNGNNYIKIYSHILLDDNTYSDIHNLINAKTVVDRIIRNTNLSIYEKLPSSFKIHRCIADDGQSFTINPLGKLGFCEHYTEDHFWGSINNSDELVEELNFVRELDDKIPLCENCPIYPSCIRLKCCPDDIICNSDIIGNKLENLTYSMISEYNKWKSNKCS